MFADRNVIISQPLKPLMYQVIIVNNIHPCLTFPSDPTRYHRAPDRGEEEEEEEAERIKIILLTPHRPR